MTDRADMLEAENAELRARIEYLENEMFSGGLLFPVEWSLTGSEARIVGLLLARPFARKEQIMTALYRDQNRDEAEQKIVDVFVCKVRKKLKPFGVVIRTIWGVGYAIDEPARGILNQALGPEMASVEVRRLLDLVCEGALAA
ncbi:MAG: winged helix-turn-helix domain-containing protein [Bradyrhizobium sp.]|nr:winged helix-turn-helix domain-containing protein [Bradyrhizobium sp.]